ncbi:uncharacterized protein BX663DRAFT_265084 [Cokeromyces recurvatus]|uniref:uncharacterized protein n=1 Tax=Cokeromyces recurvatus TaxID=90255 RepID=UPI00221FD826|nr:uncharacterized protein BX663DRAFT_265084 [Cokeromyces recurvatus]KAI7898196.1 hypothetical protein BX663DRAFT_265084 [Cokeromyces recurvatus]
MSLLDKQEITSVELANDLDAQDEFAKYRKEFEIPLKNSITNDSTETDEECIYLCGNSLGLMPKRTRTIINQELDAWAQRYVHPLYKRYTYTTKICSHTGELKAIGTILICDLG